MSAPEVRTPGGNRASAEKITSASIVASHADDCNDSKRIATLKAGFALRGFEVRECSDGGYFVSRWNLTKFCPALADLESFAAQVGATC